MCNKNRTRVAEAMLTKCAYMIRNNWTFYYNLVYSVLLYLLMKIGFICYFKQHQYGLKIKNTVQYSTLNAKTYIVHMNFNFCSRGDGICTYCNCFTDNIMKHRLCSLMVWPFSNVRSLRCFILAQRDRTNSKINQLSYNSNRSNPYYVTDHQ